MSNSREQAVFDVARGIASLQERHRYVEQACVGDRVLQARVEGLLRMHDEEQTFLEVPAAGVRAVVAHLVGEGPGANIGPYLLREQLGEGGFGIVFLAEQQYPVQRAVALKVIKPGMDTRQVVARFEAERQALALMDHPNIARVLDGGETASGRPYFVMELVRGVPITEFCDQNRFTIRQRLELFVSVCQAVQHAHQKGIIHRDLKPSNILVTRHQDTPVVKVIDFGIAKALEQKLTDKTLVTDATQLVGTPLYLSPEQAEMTRQDLDTRTDIYALGVVLYELLTGLTPYDRERLATVAFDELRRIIREEEPLRPSARLDSVMDATAILSLNRQSDVKRLRRELSGDLDWIVLKALEKDRERRYETADGLAQDIQRYLADEPVLASPPSAGYRLRKFSRRNKGQLAVGVGLFGAVLVAAASIGWAVRDRAARAEEQVQAEIARRAQVEAQVRDSLHATQTLLAANKLVAAREKLTQARLQLGSDSQTLTALTAEIEAGVQELDRFQRFLDLIDRAHEAEMAPLSELTLGRGSSRSGRSGRVGRSRSTGRRPLVAVPLILEALQLYQVMDRADWHRNPGGGLLGNQQQEQLRRIVFEELLWLADDSLERRQDHQTRKDIPPESAAQQALRYLERTEGGHSPTQALYSVRSRCFQMLGNEAAAQADTQRAADTPRTMALDYYLQGQSAFDAEQAAPAIQAFEAALRLEPTHYWSLLRLGACLCDLGQSQDDFIGAIRVFTGCIMKRPEHGHAYYCRANAYAKLKRYEDAITDLNKAIELDPRYAAVWNNRGVSYGMLDQPSRAIADLNRAIELDPDYPGAWFNRGVAQNELGYPEKAVGDYSRAIELDPNYAHAWNNRGYTWWKLNQQEKALADYTKAIELDPSYTQAWYNCGVVYNVLGKWDQAIASFTRAIELNPKEARAWTGRGFAYSHQENKLKETLADYSKAVELNPKEAQLWYNRGTIYGKMNRREEALADYTRAVELDPSHARAWNNRGLLHHEMGQLSQAGADYTKAIELSPKNPMVNEAYLLRAQVNHSLSQFDQARLDYESYLKLAPRHGPTYNGLAWLLATCPDLKVRDPARAVAMARKATELAPKVGTHWNTLGVALYRTDAWKEAAAAIEKSMEMTKGGDAFDYLFLAMARWKLGEREEARKLYDRALRWIEKNQKILEKDPTVTEELKRFRAEAEEVLEIATK